MLEVYIAFETEIVLKVYYSTLSFIFDYVNVFLNSLFRKYVAT